METRTLTTQKTPYLVDDEKFTQFILKNGKIIKIVPNSMLEKIFQQAQVERGGKNG